MHLLPTASKPLGLAALLALAAHGGLGCGGEPLPPSVAPSLSPVALSSAQTTCLSFQRGSSGQVADAELSTRQPDKQFGDKPVASVSQVNGQREHLLLRFDTSAIPAHATITSATLTLWQTNSGLSSFLRAHAVTRPWQEGSVSWRSFGSAFVSAPAASLDTPGPSHPGTRTLDVSALATTWVSQPAANHGLLLTQPEGKVLLDTSESPHPERRPRLEVCYSEPEAPAGQLPQGTSVLLQVVDSAGTPIPSAAISSQQTLFPTDSSGHLLLENLEPGRFLARVDARGYTSASVVLDIPEGAHLGQQVRLLPLGTPLSLQAEQGGVLERGHVRVTLPPNALVDGMGRPVSGTVQATLVPLDPTHQLALMPGPLEGTTTSGETLPLESLFMAEVSLWKDGAPLRLAPEASATLEFLLPDALVGRFQEGDTVPAWWFDLDAGQWREEGSGTVRPSSSHPGKLAWVATVHHFTWWNGDVNFTDKSCVNVQVVNTKGQPVPNARVTALGTSYTGASISRFTGPDGRACIEIMQGGTADIYAGLPTQPSSPKVSVTGTKELSVCGGTVACTSVRLVIPEAICAPGSYQECLPYSGPADALGKGMCRVARQQCDVSGTQWSACQGEVTPVSESCETPFDDDCDGTVNEDCFCAQQEGHACYGGPAGTQNVGLCRGGALACDLFGNISCQQQQLPRQESCSTLDDDDCDGSNECQPVSQWVRTSDSYIGSGDSMNLEVLDLTVDGQGNTLMLSRFAGSLSIGGLRFDASGSSALLVLKFDVSGKPLWGKVMHDNAGLELEDATLVVDRTGNVVVAANTVGYFVVDGIRLSNGSGGPSIVVVAIQPHGNLRWVRMFAGYSPSVSMTTAVTTDSVGDVIISGGFWNTLRFGDTTHYSGESDRLFVAELEASTGTPRWSRSFPDGSWDTPTSVTTDGEDNVLFGARGYNADDWSQEIHVSKLERDTGRTLWNQPIGPGDQPSMKVDAAGNVVVLSSTPLTLTKLSPESQLLWRRRLDKGSEGYTWYQARLDLDASGNALVSGSFMGSEDFGGGMRYSLGNTAAFVAWYDVNGGYLMDKYFLGTSPWSDWVQGGRAANAPEGKVVLGGAFSGIVDLGTQPALGPDGGLFLLSLDPTP